MFCGLVGLAGSLAPLVTAVWAGIVAEHDLVADTLSDLARGPHKMIMDVGFYIHASALVCLAIAAAHAHLGRAAWSAGIFCLALLALVVSLLGLYDDFHNSWEAADSVTVHTKLSVLLGPLYLAGPLLMAPGAARAGPVYAGLFVVSAVIWIVFATLFKMAPTGYDGILEKVAIVATLLWTVPMSRLILARGWLALARQREG
ncbi:hypothetical protein OB2597_09519 [Pseudooceanicola batsensis HTCC2597]|uniref:DUF998 domain-containing protein n=1 Tax=Pseudooceanicola batsensis (strain ATCC BAA-863 / DSM 15984 / KCTC 12145 / HTCC2597) TaxID=252305 RepID=A3TV26_PSEBH|nr:hypothetical protein OB2597_09519 [Pseudooceanicola batsensis HTCC2597]